MPMYTAKASSTPPREIDLEPTETPEATLARQRAPQNQIAITPQDALRLLQQVQAGLLRRP